MNAKTCAEDIRNQAEEWFFRLQSPSLTSEERAVFGEWLIADPAHQSAYFELERTEDLWGELDNRKDLPEVAMAYRSVEAIRSRGRGRWKLLFATAASVLLLVGLWLVNYQIRVTDGQYYETGLGEQRIVNLEDGSRVMLNALTSLTIDYQIGKRRIELHKGQANFNVKKAPKRPFVVESSAGKVEALGTQFDVYQRGNKVTVTLYEGQVKVKPEQPTEDSDSVLILDPGQAVDFNRQSFLSNVVKVNIDRAQSWQERRLDFHNTPLSEVIDEVNRYSSRRLQLADLSLGALEISGVFEAGDSEAVVAALETYFKVRVIKSDNLIVIKAPLGPRD